MKPHNCIRWIVAAVVAVAVLCPLQALAQGTARFYWKSLSGGYGVPVAAESMSGNTNPFDPSHAVTPNANFVASLAFVGVGTTFSLSGRAAWLSISVPMGKLESVIVEDGLTSVDRAAGFGDPMIEFGVNIIGPKAQNAIPDILRYQPGFSVDLLADLAIPIGEYNHDQPLNIGLNRWYGRLAAPIIVQIGPWVPGRRTTLEFFPSLWIMGDNNDFMGQTIKTDPAFQLEGHLTRDFMARFWGSLDAVWFTGAQASINGVAAGEGLNNVGLGLTLGYTLNENMGLRFAYKSTINDRDPQKLRMDVFQVSLVVGWHPIIEGIERLKGEK